MSNRRSGISAESIQDLNDVKTWARNHEIRMNNRTKNIQDDIQGVKDVSNQIQKISSRNTKLLGIIYILFVVVAF